MHKAAAIKSAVVSETSRPITIPSPMKNSIKPRAFPIIHTALPLWFSIFYAEMPHLNTLTSKITACSFYNQLLDQIGSRACLKKAFCKMCVTICGRFRSDEGAVAGYGNRIRVKYTAKWGVQIAGMIFQTRSSSLRNLQFHLHCYLRQVRSGLQSQEPYPEL